MLDIAIASLKYSGRSLAYRGMVHNEQGYTQGWPACV